MRWSADGKLSAHVHAVYPLADTATRAERHRRAQDHGQGAAAALSPTDPAIFLRAASRCSGRIASLTSLIAAASIAASSAKPSIGSKSGMAVERHDEIGERAEQDRAHLERGLVVEGAIIGGEQILRSEGSRASSRFSLPQKPRRTVRSSCVVDRLPGPLLLRAASDVSASASWIAQTWDRPRSPATAYVPQACSSPRPA